MNFKNFIIIILVMLLPLSLSAAEASNFDKTLSSVYILVRVFGALSALILAFMGIRKLVDYSKDDRNPKNSPMSAIVIFFAAGLMMNLDQSMTIMVNTINGSGGYCFYGDTSSNTTFGNDSSCFENAMSVTDDLAKQMQNKTKTEESMSKLKDKLKTLFMLFQIVGVIYFIKGVYMLKAASEGAQDVTYGKIIMILIASTLVIDMPHTIDMIISLISSWNETT
jgi:hypothetical protein